LAYSRLSERERVTRKQRVRIVHGELEPGNDEQVIQATRSLALGRQLAERGGEASLLDVPVHGGVVGYREHVEPGATVAVAELPRRELRGHLSAQCSGFPAVSWLRRRFVTQTERLGR
jgi:hypothetical protein